MPDNDLIPVKSSWIARMGRDPVSGNVTVETRNGETYVYTSIDDQLFDSWLASPSAGGFFSRHISGRYPSQKRSKSEE